MKVRFEDLTKTFGTLNAVDHFNVEFEDGELISLLGPSGCGKSTILNMLAGILPVTGGKIWFDSDDVTNLPPEERGIGLVFQNYALYPHLTVQQNIMFPLQNFKGEKKLSKEVMLEKAKEAAKLVQIDTLMERKPNELSGGQQQRVAIARALVKEPKVLLLDEPLSNLDARLRLQTREEIRRIQRETKVTTIFVTHDQEEAMSISDLIVVMKDGLVHQIGKPQEVYDDPVNLFVAKFLGTPPINVFKGKVKDHKIYIGDNAILETKKAKDGDVYVAIRPEGFILNESGELEVELKGLEVMGRDTTIVSTHEACENVEIRSIVSAETRVDPDAKMVRFSVKPAKTYIFDAESGERILY